MKSSQVAEISVVHEMDVVMNKMTQAPKRPNVNIFSDRMLISEIIKTGISYKIFSLLKQLSPFTNEEWSDFLRLSEKSISRYKAAGKNFKSIQSEKILEIAEVTRTGLEVFDTPEQFRHWLETPNLALGKKKPKELLHDSYGKDLVIAELVRIDQGIFA